MYLLHFLIINSKIVTKSLFFFCQNLVLRAPITNVLDVSRNHKMVPDLTVPNIAGGIVLAGGIVAFLRFRSKHSLLVGTTLGVGLVVGGVLLSRGYYVGHYIAVGKKSQIFMYKLYQFIDFFRKWIITHVIISLYSNIISNKTGNNWVWSRGSILSC